MKIRRLFWKLAVVLLCTTLAHGKDNPEATANYEKALRQLKSGDFKIDFKALRLNCAASKHECEAHDKGVWLLFSLLNEKKFDQALRKVNEALEKVFVDAELHYIAFIANTESGDKERAEFHKTVIDGLVDSILENKQGRSEDAAFVVINVNEEYTLLRFINLQVIEQRLSDNDGQLRRYAMQRHERRGPRSDPIFQCRYPHAEDERCSCEMSTSRQ